MKITEIEAFKVGVGWKNWIFIKVHNDKGIHGVGEGPQNGFNKATEAVVNELNNLGIGKVPRRIQALSKRLLNSVSLYLGHIQRTAIAAIEFGCWDVLGKILGVPIRKILSGRMRDSVLG